jgi:uncharacterized protein Yka (UPF0111/DUF47 family)
MVSVQRFLVKNNQCLDLLEASAAQARTSVSQLVALVRTAPPQRSLEHISSCRSQHKRITKDLTEHLCRTFVTPMEREDIARLSTALNRVSKAVEKFCERYLLAPHHVADWSLDPQMAILSASATTLDDVVKELCHEARMEEVRALNTRLQQAESDADRLLETSLQGFYGQPEASVRWVVQKDLMVQLEKVFDRCRSVGNIAYWTLLRNS